MVKSKKPSLVKKWKTGLSKIKRGLEKTVDKAFEDVDCVLNFYEKDYSTIISEVDSINGNGKSHDKGIANGKMNGNGHRHLHKKKRTKFSAEMEFEEYNPDYSSLQTYNNVNYFLEQGKEIVHNEQKVSSSAQKKKKKTGKKKKTAGSEPLEKTVEKTPVEIPIIDEDAPMISTEEIEIEKPDEKEDELPEEIEDKKSLYNEKLLYEQSYENQYNEDEEEKEIAIVPIHDERLKKKRTQYECTIQFKREGYLMKTKLERDIDMINRSKIPNPTEDWEKDYHTKRGIPKYVDRLA